MHYCFGPNVFTADRQIGMTVSTKIDMQEPFNLRSGLEHINSGKPPATQELKARLCPGTVRAEEGGPDQPARTRACFH